MPHQSETSVIGAVSNCASTGSTFRPSIVRHSTVFRSAFIPLVPPLSSLRRRAVSSEDVSAECAMKRCPSRYVKGMVMRGHGLDHTIDSRREHNIVCRTSSSHIYLPTATTDTRVPTVSHSVNHALLVTYHLNLLA